MAQEQSDFEEEIFEEFEDEEPTPKKSAAAVAPPKKPNTPNLGVRKAVAPAPAPQRTALVENTAPEVQAPKRYNLYAIPARSGIFDTVENRPIIEEGNEMSLILATLEEILNRINKLEERI